MDRDRANIPEQQLRFLDGIAGPVFQLVTKIELFRPTNSIINLSVPLPLPLSSIPLTPSLLLTPSHSLPPPHSLPPSRLLSQLIPESAEVYHSLLENREHWAALKATGKRFSIDITTELSVRLPTHVE